MTMVINFPKQAAPTENDYKYTITELLRIAEVNKVVVLWEIPEI